MYFPPYMGHQKLRTDKTCLNCNYVVENKYCPNCGQENVESKQSFHYLFTHFLEDLTHYDGGFWITIKTLLFKPAVLTKEYIDGKRKKYVPPVKLYIFISFIAFFIPSILPDFSSYGDSEDIIEINPDRKETEQNKTKKDENYLFWGHKYESLKEMDSIEHTLPESERLTGIDYYFEKRAAEINEKYTSEEINEKAKESMVHNLPKVLFLYLPFFAFMLWLFHGKRRWYYFEHGVFTLHYFAFILLTITCLSILNCLISLLPNSIYRATMFFAFIIMMGWWFFYFFRSHRKYYGEKRWVSRLKGFGLFFINVFLIIVFLVGAFMYSLLNIH